MDLQGRIKDISEYFKGFEFVENLLIIKVQYKDKWDVFGKKDESIKVTPDENIPNLYFYYGDSSLGYDEFFDLIEHTIQYNLEKEEKLHLLNEKIKELKDLFIQEDVETLRTLKFICEKGKKKTQQQKKRGRKPKVEKESVVEDKVNVSENNTVVEEVQPVEEKETKETSTDSSTLVLDRDNFIDVEEIR